jgi:hypothetical protein
MSRKKKRKSNVWCVKAIIGYMLFTDPEVEQMNIIFPPSVRKGWIRFRYHHGREAIEKMIAAAIRNQNTNSTSES